MGATSFDLDWLGKQVRPYRVQFFPRLKSTNEYAAELRRRGELYAPAIVLAGQQMKGRGRGRNTWWSGPGSITATFVEPIHEEVPLHQIPLIAGLAIRNAVAEITNDQNIELKWPNDLLYGTRKLAGLLCERVGRVNLIGVGLNVNLAPADTPANLRNRVTSLSRIVGQSLDKAHVLSVLARHLHEMLSRRDEFPFAAVLREYDRHHVLRGRRVTISDDANRPIADGTCQGMDAMGRLLVRDAGKVVRVIAGHVQLR